MSNFGNNLNSLRKKAGYSQEELAYKLKVTRQTISNWELEQTSPDLKDLKNISEVFNISLNELMSDNNFEQSNTKNINKKNKLFLIIFLVILLLIILFFIHRVFIILNVKKSLDKVCNSNNIYIEKQIISENNFNQEVTETYKLYYLNSKIKIVRLNNNDLSRTETFEILDDNYYYFINENEKTYYKLPIDEFYNTINKDLAIDKDNLLNSIYANCLLSNNKESLNLIFNFKFNIKNDFKQYYYISNIKNRIENYALLRVDNSLENINYTKKLKKKDNIENSSDIYSYMIKINCLENKDLEIPDLNLYQNVDI